LKEQLEDLKLDYEIDIKSIAEKDDVIASHNERLAVHQLKAANLCKLISKIREKD